MGERERERHQLRRTVTQTWFSNHILLLNDTWFDHLLISFTESLLCRRRCLAAESCFDYKYSFFCRLKGDSYYFVVIISSSSSTLWWSPWLWSFRSRARNCCVIVMIIMIMMPILANDTKMIWLFCFFRPEFLYAFLTLTHSSPQDSLLQSSTHFSSRQQQTNFAGKFTSCQAK